MSTPLQSTNTVEIAINSVAGLRAMRRELAAILHDAAWPEPRILDAQVALAEIATNAFVHDAAPRFTVRVACTATVLTMTTSHAGTTLPPSAPVDVADTDVVGGRGLAIVDRLADSRHVTSTDGVTSTEVSMGC